MTWSISAMPRRYYLSPRISADCSPTTASMRLPSAIGTAIGSASIRCSAIPSHIIGRQSAAWHITITVSPPVNHLIWHVPRKLSATIFAMCSRTEVPHVLSSTPEESMARRPTSPTCSPTTKIGRWHSTWGWDDGQLWLAVRPPPRLVYVMACPNTMQHGVADNTHAALIASHPVPEKDDPCPVVATTSSAWSCRLLEPPGTVKCQMNRINAHLLSNWKIFRIDFFSYRYSFINTWIITFVPIEYSSAWICQECFEVAVSLKPRCKWKPNYTWRESFWSYYRFLLCCCLCR